MALLIYKQWHQNANKPKTRLSNSQHIKYIGERVHVLKTEGKANGLFGKFGDYGFRSEISTEEAVRYVNDISFQRKTVYRSFISFTPERAELLELNDKTAWENYVKYHANTLAKNNGLNLKGFEYIAAVHNKVGQPHVHISFWDTTQQIHVNVVSPELCDLTRSELELNTFGELAQEMNDVEIVEDCENADNIRKELINKTFANERQAHFDFWKESKHFLDKIPEQNLATSELVKAFSKLYDQHTPDQNGKYSYRYAYQTEGFKNLLDDFTDKIVNTFPDLQNVWKLYFESKYDYAAMTHSKTTNYGKWEIATYVGKAKDQLYSEIGNKILKELKKCRNDLYILRQERNESERNKISFDCTMRIATGICRILRDFSRQKRTPSPFRSGQNVAGQGDLSKAAKLDFVFKRKDKSRER